MKTSQVKIFLSFIDRGRYARFQVFYYYISDLIALENPSHFHRIIEIRAGVSAYESWWLIIKLLCVGESDCCRYTQRPTGKKKQHELKVNVKVTVCYSYVRRAGNVCDPAVSWCGRQEMI